MPKLIYLFILTILITGCNTKVTNSRVDPVLKYEIKEPTVESKDSPLLILLHGWGSNEADLFELAPVLPEEYLIVSARAPYTRSTNSYEWYDLDFSNGTKTSNYEQAEKSRLILKQFINQLKSLHTFDHQKIILGGFSQGGIMSYSLGLTEPGLVHGIMPLSGRMLEEIKPIVKTDHADELEILIIHGIQDQVLPIDDAREAKEFLENKNFKVDYHELEMGHSINNEAIQLINEWLLKI